MLSMSASTLLCGAAKRCITPPDDLFPLPKNASGIAFGGVLDDLHVRALAIESKGTRALLLSFDLGGVPLPDRFLPLISERTGVLQQNILYFAVHTHTSPNAGRPDPDPTRVPTPETEKKHRAYLQLLETQMLAAAEEAVASLRPARLGIGYGKSYINVNRNQMYRTRHADGTETVECALGVNPEGPSDKTLFVAAFEDPDGRPIAFLVNYAVHAVVMHANRCFGDLMAISGDIPGNVCSLLEENHPGAVALWSSGAAGDQNAVMMNQIYLPDPKTGARTVSTIEGGDANMLRTLVCRHLDDIEQVIRHIQCETIDPLLTAAVDVASVPGRNVIPVDPKRPRGECTYSYEDAAPYEVRMQLLRLGDLAFVALSGELYTRLGLHLRAVSPLQDTVLITHCANCCEINGRVINNGYIYDDEAMADGAFGSRRTRMQPGYIRQALEKTMLSLFKNAQ